ncbi:MAG: 2-thiouracil desulfurase family protein [Coriobacteriia bacterium]
MPELITRKVPLGVSACVFRCPVRYNGRAFDALATIGRERSDFSFTPVCPECMAGLGVPRDPIHLTGTGQEVLAGTARVKSRRGHDVTQEVIAGSRACLEALERAGVRAMIVMEASPTCGVYKARVGKRRTETSEGSGVFGAMLLDTGWFLIPDKALANPLLWWDWRRRLHAWLWLSDRKIERASDLYSAWHTVKFVLQETGRPFADAMGRELAALPKNPPLADLKALRTRMLDGLRTPSTRSRIAGAMLKTYKHHAKRGTLDGVDLHDLSIDSPEFRANVMNLAEELNRLERISFENDMLFGTSPVIFRDGRRAAGGAKEKGT